MIKSNDKKCARLNRMLHFLSALDYPGKDPEIPPPDPLIVSTAQNVLHGFEHILGKSLHPDNRKKR